MSEIAIAEAIASSEIDMREPGDGRPVSSKQR